MVSLSKQFKVDTWLVASWDEYLAKITEPIYQTAKGYYYAGQSRIEMTTIGNEHSQDHAIINHAIYLYATLKGIPLTGKDNCSYRCTGSSEFQPDLSYYVQANADAVPREFDELRTWQEVKQVSLCPPNQEKV